MSGTSMDGLDIALCTFQNTGKNTIVHIDAFESVPYESNFKKYLHALTAPHASVSDVCLWNKRFGTYTANQINLFLEKHQLSSKDVDCIASHGQTIYHAPLRQHQQKTFGNATLQIGDADQVSVLTGIVTLSDFRQKHIAAGGEGAPLAAYLDYLLFADENTDVIMLNIGGIANYTYLPVAPFKTIFSTDTGPGNTLMDAWMQQFENRPFDKNAALASEGEIIQPMLEHLMTHSFLSMTVPKTTGPETFNLRSFNLGNPDVLSGANVMATLTYFTARTIADNIKTHCGYNRSKIYATGGGVHNPLLMRFLKELLPVCSFHDTIEKNIPGDAKEAVLFALLANECIAGNPQDFIHAGLPAVRLGKISLPG
jgi:anhydro-N-acetylmuramic acid kinase